MMIGITIWIQEFLNGILPLWDRSNCKNFVGSAALTEVCSLRMLLVWLICLVVGCLLSIYLCSSDHSGLLAA